jgi:hypothetical protein
MIERRTFIVVDGEREFAGGSGRGWESLRRLQQGLAVCATRLWTTASLLVAVASPGVVGIVGDCCRASAAVIFRLALLRRRLR